MFQAYLITCMPTGKKYIGITSASLKRRWSEHIYGSSKRTRGNALYAAIAKYGRDAFTMEAICCSFSWQDLCAVESILIQQWDTLAPRGLNLATGGHGRYGFKPSKESVEKSAAKHRGKPCHPNTKRRASEVHRGKTKSEEHRRNISAGKMGKPRSLQTKAKLSAYWAKRRAAGEFKTQIPYEHYSASAQIARIPEPLARHIAKCFYPAATVNS